MGHPETTFHLFELFGIFPCGLQGHKRISAEIQRNLLYLSLRYSFIAILDEFLFFAFPNFLGCIRLWRFFPCLLFDEKLISFLCKRSLGE
jgi:hypothetical protein